MRAHTHVDELAMVMYGNACRRGALVGKRFPDLAHAESPFLPLCLSLSLSTRKTEPLSDSGKSLLEFSILCSLPSLRAQGQHGGGFESGARRGRRRRTKRRLWSNRHLFKPTAEERKSNLPLFSSRLINSPQAWSVWCLSHIPKWSDVLFMIDWEVI